MKILREDVWKRRGISLLWGAQGLSAICKPEQVVSLRQFFSMTRAWPSELPSNEGASLVVAGLDGCMDLLSPEDAEVWLKTELLPGVLAFQDEWGLDAALVFWLPSAKNRIRMNRANDAYSWVCAAPHSHQILELGRVLWAGAEDAVGRILLPGGNGAAALDPDGPAWIGLHHPRLS